MKGLVDGRKWRDGRNKEVMAGRMEDEKNGRMEGRRLGSCKNGWKNKRMEGNGRIEAMKDGRMKG